MGTRLSGRWWWSSAGLPLGDAVSGGRRLWLAGEAAPGGAPGAGGAGAPVGGDGGDDGQSPAVLAVPAGGARDGLAGAGRAPALHSHVSVPGPLGSDGGGPDRLCRIELLTISEMARAASCARG